MSTRLMLPAGLTALEDESRRIHVLASRCQTRHRMLLAVVALTVSQFSVTAAQEIVPLQRAVFSTPSTECDQPLFSPLCAARNPSSPSYSCQCPGVAVNQSLTSQTFSDQPAGWPAASGASWSVCSRQDPPPNPGWVQDAPSLDPSSPRSGKTGTTLDSLPSFRGIKGIKNLPGGVGTILMANPHVGATWYPDQPTNQPGTSLGIQRTYFQAGVPVYHNGPDTVVFTSHMDVMNVNTKAILPTTMQPFPGQLYNVALGANYFHQFENGNVGGIVFDVGSASDVPFHSSGEMLASGTAFMLIPDGDRNAWFVGVNASTNNQVLYGLPIPGGGYFYNPSDNFQAIFGFPFSVVSWKPSRDWQLQYVYAFLTTMHARAVYQPTTDWQLYAGFDWNNENWRRVDRPTAQDHFFYYEKRLAAGWLYWFQPNVGFELSGGYAFDRYFTEVDGFKLVGSNTVRIGSGPFLTAQFDVRF